MEINREQTLSIFCELVDRLRSKREFEIIEATYSRLRKHGFISSVEDFIDGSIEEALLFRFHLAFMKSRTVDNFLEPDEVKGTPCTLEELGKLF